MRFVTYPSIEGFDQNSHSGPAMTFRRRLARIALILLLFPPLLAAVAGWLMGHAFLQHSSERAAARSHSGN
jgi:hypothetical protein